MARGGAGEQRGDTLVEVLIAIVVLAVVGLAAFAGLQTAIRSSVDSRELGRAEAIVRSAAENLQNPETPYVDEAGCGAGNYSSLATLPAGYSLTVPDVQFWTSTATSPVGSGTTVPTTFGGCPPSGDDPGLQLVTLRVATPAGATAELDVLKRRPNAP